jgi:hypothetical protein
MYSCCEYSYFGLINPFHCSPLSATYFSPIFQQLSVHILTSSTFTGIMLYDTSDIYHVFFLSLFHEGEMFFGR